MSSEDLLHKKPRMDDYKEVVEDVEPVKIVSANEFFQKSKLNFSQMDFNFFPVFEME